MNSNNQKPNEASLMNECGVIPKAEVEIENAVLGAMMIEGDVAVKVIPDMNVDFFYDEKNQCVFRAIQELVQHGHKVDMLTVTEQLKRMNLLEKAGGAYHITTVCGMVASAANIDYHINILADFYLRRLCIMATMKATNRFFDLSTDFSETAFDLVKLLTQNLNSMPLDRKSVV